MSWVSSVEVEDKKFRNILMGLNDIVEPYRVSADTIRK